MRRGIGIVALLALLAALGGGGVYLYREWTASAPPQNPVPVRSTAPVQEEWPVPELAGDAPTGEVTATLVELRRVVKARRADDLAWKDARARMRLFQNDVVRTLEDSTATIEFDKNDLVEVGQNALVVIRPRRPEAETPEISLALLSADLLDSLQSKTEDEQKQAIAAAAETRQVRIRKLPASGGGNTRTHVAVKTLPDRSTSVASLAGDVKLVAPSGQEVVLKKNMGTRLTPQGKVAAPRILPAAPDLVRPRNGARYPFLRHPPEIELRWKPAARAGAYRLLVARDKAFKRIFAEEMLSRTSFTIRILNPGTYYWRVRSQDADGFEGAYSAARSLRTVRDDAPPQLVLKEPPEMFVSPSAQVELKGTTDRGARIRVNGEDATVGADGGFIHTLTLKEGVNLITVEAVDGAGNTTYGKRLITYRGRKRSRTAGITGER